MSLFEVAKYAAKHAADRWYYGVRMSDALLSVAAIGFSGAFLATVLVVTRSVEAQTYTPPPVARLTTTSSSQPPPVVVPPPTATSGSTGPPATRPTTAPSTDGGQPPPTTITLPPTTGPPGLPPTTVTLPPTTGPPPTTRCVSPPSNSHTHPTRRQWPCLPHR